MSLEVDWQKKGKDQYIAEVGDFELIVVRHRSNDWYLGKGYAKGTYDRRGVDDISKAQRFRTVKTAKNALRQIGYSEEAISQMEVVNINDPEKRGYEL